MCLSSIQHRNMLQFSPKVSMEQHTWRQARTSACCVVGSFRRNSVSRNLHRLNQPQPATLMTIYRSLSREGSDGYENIDHRRLWKKFLFERSKIGSWYQLTYLSYKRLTFTLNHSLTHSFPTNLQSLAPYILLTLPFLTTAASSSPCAASCLAAISAT